MKIILAILTILGGFVLWNIFSKQSQNPKLLTTAQRNDVNNATLAAYSQIMPPIAQLARVPLTNGNLRMVDPVMPQFVYPDVISQNGNN